jgi:hypothetical protein
MPVSTIFQIDELRRVHCVCYSEAKKKPAKNDGSKRSRSVSARKKGFGRKVYKARAAWGDCAMSEQKVHVLFTVERGIVIWLPVNATIKNRDGDTVPGMVLSASDARELARKIREQAKRMEVFMEMG